MGSVPQTKACSKCGLEKPVTDYYVKVRATGCLFRWCKACHSRTRKEKYLANHLEEKAKARERGRRYYRERPEVFAEAQRRYRKKHPGLIAARRRERYRNDPDYRRRVVEGVRDYRERNPEANREAARRDYQANRERYYANNHRRRARLKGAGGCHTAAEWEEVKRRQGYRCLDCGKREPEIRLHRDHVVPVSRGGTNDAGNLAARCKSCNSRKGARLIPEAGNGREARQGGGGQAPG